MTEPSVNPFHDAILAALPGTMQEIGTKVGVTGQVLWDTMHTLRRAGIIVRSRGKNRVFSLKPEQPAVEPEQAAEELGISPGLAAKRAKTAQRNNRKRPVVLVWITGWPKQEPNRRMVWQVQWGSKAKAERVVRDLKALIPDEDVNWELASMSMAEVRKMRLRGFDLKERLELAQKLREAEEARQS